MTTATNSPRKITKRTVDALKPGELVWDAEVKGFGVRCQRAAKVYVLKTRVGGRQRWITIGRHGSPWTPEKARGKAMSLLGDGVDIEPEVREGLEQIEFHRVIALLTVLDRSPELPPPGALQQPADPVFTFVADNQAKGISDVPAMTFHTAHALSADLWTRSDDDIEAELSPAAAQIVAPARIVDLRLRRWLHTGPVVAHPDPCVVAARNPGPLVLAGDGFGGSKVEGAYRSGRAAAAAIIDSL